MLSKRIDLTIGLLLLICGCYHPIEIVGEGDVISASGSRSCLLEDFAAGAVNCSQNPVEGDDSEAYSGIARPGWQFRRWAQYCGDVLTNECSFDIPAEAVELGAGRTMPAQQAVFRAIENTGFTSLFIGQAFMAPLVAGIEAHAVNAGFDDHHTTTTFTGAGVMGAIYPVDLVSYSYAPGFTTDVKLIAQTILDEQPEKYRSPPEVDIVTDGDGIVDRLDPNPSGKPNILIMMADDLGYNDLAINNANSGIDTPRMDQLARDGVRFTRHYGAAVCSPARAAFLTGLYPERAGFRPNALGISPNVLTMPERLQQEGYATWHIGKWHIGDTERSAWPDHQGFDHWFGFLNQWRLAGVHVDGELQLAKPRYQDPWLEGDTEPGQSFSGHLEDILTDKAIDVITELNNDQQPWFVNLWFYAPHGPVQPASEFATLYPDTNEGHFRALVNQLDTNMGRILDHLDNLGVLEDTIIVMVSDNGGTNLVLDNNAPFAGNKLSVREGGLRTPLIIRWPDSSLNRRVVSDIVGIEDLYPTLLSAIGEVAPDDIDGVSFYDELTQQLPLPQRDRFWEMGSDSYGVLSADGRWRLYQSYPIWGVDVDPVIFDMELDPTATLALMPTPAEQLTAMTDAYLSWFRDVHTVSTDHVPSVNGSGILTGSDFLRTPGFGEYTFGIAIQNGFDGQIAAQTGIWSLSRSGDTVTAQVGELTLSGDIQSEDSCHSIVLSGNLQRHVSTSSGPDHTSLALYIDGTEVQSVEDSSQLSVIDSTIDTVIGDPGVPSNSGSQAPPVILNVELNADTPWSVDAFGLELCASQ